MRTYLSTCAILLWIVSAVQPLECYFGETHINDKPVSYKNCNTPPFNHGRYCVKIIRFNRVLRECDDLHFCERVGNGCVPNRSYGQTNGEVCCCDGNYCNAVSRVTISALLYIIVITVTIFIMN